MTKTKPKPKAKKKTARTTLVAFLLDRSGSMSNCHQETISGFNSYLKGLKGTNLKFTLTQFDSQSVDIIHNAVPLAKVKELTAKSYQPRGWTPLYDAIGKTVRATEKSAKEANVLFVTLTDGKENASSEWNQSTVRNLILEKEKDGWTFAHIGVGLDGFSAVSDYSSGTQSFSNVTRSSHKDTADAYSRLGAVTVSWASAAGAHGASGAKGPMGSVGNIWEKSDKKKKPSAV